MPPTNQIELWPFARFRRCCVWGLSLCDRQRSSEQLGASEVGYGSEMKAIMVIAFAQLTMR